jgi:TRAP-type C4-dicarboxylate transport system permease small subunit
MAAAGAGRWRHARHARRATVLFALAAIAMFGFVALVGSATHSSGDISSSGHEAHATPTIVTGEHESGVATSPALRLQPGIRSRATVGAIAAAAVVVLFAFQRLARRRASSPRTVRVAGRPPGRAPPFLGIA